MRSQENSDLTRMFKRVSGRLLLVPVFGDRMNGYSHDSELFQTMFRTEGTGCIHSHTFLLCICVVREARGWIM